MKLKLKIISRKSMKNFMNKFLYIYYNLFYFINNEKVFSILFIIFHYINIFNILNKLLFRLL